MGSQRRRRKGGGGGEGHGGSERWLLTYADMITLLMAFFIMMYSMSVLNLKKFNEVAFSIRSGFGGMMPGRGQHLLSQPTGRKLVILPSSGTERAPMINLRNHMQSYITQNMLNNKVSMQQDARGTIISIVADEMLFQRGSAELTGQAQGLLTLIGRLLQNLPNNVLVEGHACSLPIDTPIFPTNWELSAARACRVVRFLSTSGVVPTRMCAVGYGDTRPHEPNTSEAARLKNRRVDIVILDDAEANRSAAKPFAPAGASARPTIPKIRLHIPKVWDETTQTQ